MVNHWVKSEGEQSTIGGDRFSKMVSNPEDDQKTNAAICHSRIILIDEVAKAWPS